MMRHVSPSYYSQRNAKATAEYKQDHIYARSSVDLFRGPTIQSDLVVGFVSL
jgi:hypothetical protein